MNAGSKLFTGLPEIKKGETNLDETSRSNNGDLKVKRILVADDEKPLAKAMQLKLKASGFEVDIAFNGEEALEKIKNGKYDIFLFDLIMPKLDGFGVMSKLKSEGNKTPIIVTSNLSQPEDIKKAKDEFGAVEFFIKSNTPLKDIVAFIQKYLSK